jgi:peptidoglycan/xylan/chitin deacetylase (PgdA/CDA1 family)
VRLLRAGTVALVSNTWSSGVTATQGGALVISLDFELHWGMRDKERPNGQIRSNLLGVRKAVPRMLDCFERYGVAATWATVGFLFARNQDELSAFCPAIRPAYENSQLAPWDEPVGLNELGDPLHYAPSLIDRISRRPRQEIATHTYSHYYCQEAGQTAASFDADLQSAVAIAARRGHSFRSIVFPRNQHNPAYADVLLRNGIVSYRGNARSWMYRGDLQTHRMARLVDSCGNLSGPNTIGWESLIEPETGLVNVPASFMLRPWSARLAGLRQRRIEQCLTHAARHGEIAHLWWHPHNFGSNTDRNIAMLNQILGHFERLRDQFGMESLTMLNVAERVGVAVPERRHAA